MKRSSLTVLSSFLFFVSVAQVTFTTLPKDNQMCPRNLSTNKGTITVAGTVNSTGTNFDTMIVKLYRDSVLQTSFKQSLIYSGIIANFSFSISITAELHNYKIEIYGSQSSVLTLHTTVNSLAAGDAFIIQGQSNAVAGAVSGYGNAENQNSFIRVYGSGDAGGYTSVWFKANGDAWDGNGNAGQWGLRMAKDILDAFHIPVAIFNGGAGGQVISYFQRNDGNPADPTTNYGRLLQRVTDANMLSNIRAIFWYQGESNSFGTSTISYKNSFNDLNNDWLNNYPGFEHLYIIQIKQGCGAAKSDLNKIQEAQRQLAGEISNASIYATNGTNQASDICHYNYSDGCKLTGDHLFNLVLRDLYGAPYTPNIESPYVTSAAQTAHNQITLKLKNEGDNYTWEPGSEKDFIIDGSSVKVSAGFFTGNLLKLTLSSSLSSFSGISFQGHEGKGIRSIRNANGLGMVGFQTFPVIPYSARFSFTEQEKPIWVFPNPASDHATLKYKISQNEEASLVILSVDGRKVFEEHISRQGQEWQSTNVDVSNFPKGIYEVLILSGSETSREKLVIQ